MRWGKRKPDPDLPDPAEAGDGPQQVWIELADGARISCDVIEDPDGAPEGLRLFLLEPRRPLTPGEQPRSVRLDRLPARSKVTVRWPEPFPHGAAGTVTWRDGDGQTHRTSIEPGDLDDPDDPEGGSGDMRARRR